MIFKTTKRVPSVLSELGVCAITVLMCCTSCGSDSGDKENSADTVSVSTDTNPEINSLDTSLPVIDTTGFGDPDVVPEQFKIGHIYSELILVVMPKRIAVDKELEALAAQLERDIANKYKEYEEKYKRLLSDTTVSEARQQALVNELASLETTIQKMQVGGQQDLLAEKERRYQPILDVINTAIKKVAKAQGYTYIIDASLGSLVYGMDTYDITPLVKKELGLK